MNRSACTVFIIAEYYRLNLHRLQSVQVMQTNNKIALQITKIILVFNILLYEKMKSLKPTNTIVEPRNS